MKNVKSKILKLYKKQNAKEIDFLKLILYLWIIGEQLLYLKNWTTDDSDLFVFSDIFSLLQQVSTLFQELLHEDHERGLSKELNKKYSAHDRITL